VLQQQYVLIAANNIDLTRLTFSIDSTGMTLLQDGAELSIDLNQTHVGTVKLDKSVAQPVRLSLSIAADIVAADPEKPVVLSLSLPTSAVTGDDVSHSLLWQQLESYGLIEWQAQKPDVINLASYPFPLLSMQERVPTTIMIPDSPTESELNQLIRLVAFLGANGHPVDDFHVMTPAAIDRAVLESSNVIVIGSVERQKLSQELSTQANQTLGIGVESVLPTFESGLMWLGVSPWNSDHYIVVATGVTESASIRASGALERTTLLVNRPVMGAIIRPDGAIVPFGGFDHVALPNSITDVAVANAAIAGHLSQ
jgi:hypothetical protein